METANDFMKGKPLRLGIWGLGRGQHFLDSCRALNIQVVAGCDYNPEMRETFQKNCPEAFVTDDEDEFLSRDTDAVLVATYFFSHARDTIKALEAGKHVLCEVTAFFTPAEAVQVIEAVERTGKVYNLAENYPFMKSALFAKSLWEKGICGELAYAEYDYVHDCRGLCYAYINSKPVLPGNTVHSWRSWLNFHYYCTHSLGPVMKITGTRPVEITAPPTVKRLPGYIDGSEMGGMCPSLIKMDNGGVMRNLMGASTRDSHSCGRIWGTRASIQINDSGSLDIMVGQAGNARRLNLNPQWPEHKELAERAGHGGGDFWELYYFAREIRSGEKAPWSLYDACDVTLAGIMAVKSQRLGGHPVAIPDLRTQAGRDGCRNDHFAQEHFAQDSIFPREQDLSITTRFSEIMTGIYPFEKVGGAILANSAFDGMMLYASLRDDTSRLAVVKDVQELLDNLDRMAEIYRNAQRIIRAYPQSAAGKALQEALDAGKAAEILDTEKTRRILTDWLCQKKMPS